MCYDRPSIYNNGKIRIFDNHSGEIFVQDLKSGITLRINDYVHGSGGLEFTTDGMVMPTMIGSRIGWCIVPHES